MSEPVDHTARAAELAKRETPFPVLAADHPDKGAHVLYLGPNLSGEVLVAGRVYDLNGDTLKLDSHDEALAVGHAAHPGRRGVAGYDHPDSGPAIKLGA